MPAKIEDLADSSKREDWVENKNLKVFSVYSPDNIMEHVDILLGQDIDFGKAYERREAIKAGDLAINLIAIDDLIRLKEVAGRERDRIDVKALLKIKELRDGRQD